MQFSGYFRHFQTWVWQANALEIGHWRRTAWRWTFNAQTKQASWENLRQHLQHLQAVPVENATVRGSCNPSQKKLQLDFTSKVEKRLLHRPRNIRILADCSQVGFAVILLDRRMTRKQIKQYLLAQASALFMKSPDQLLFDYCWGFETKKINMRLRPLWVMAVESSWLQWLQSECQQFNWRITKINAFLYHIFLWVYHLKVFGDVTHGLILIVITNAELLVCGFSFYELKIFFQVAIKEKCFAENSEKMACQLRQTYHASRLFVSHESTTFAILSEPLSDALQIVLRKMELKYQHYQWCDLWPRDKSMAAWEALWHRCLL